MAERRACSGTTKAGKPCRGNPLTDSDYCMAHSDAETKASVGFVPEAGKLGGRPKNPRAVDVLRDKLEAEIDAWLDVLVDAREAQKAIVVGAGEGAFLELIPDYTVRLRAFQEAFDRVYGKPKQATELSGPGGDPIRTEGDALDPSKLNPEQLRTYLTLVKAMRGDGGEA